MISSFEDLARVLKLVFVDERPPKSLNLVEAVTLARTGSHSVREAARLVGTTSRVLQALVDTPSPLTEVLGGDIPLLSSDRAPRVRSNLGQLVIGNLAERVFEDLYRTSVATSELQLKDDRQGRGDTDYLVFNGSGRQIFRINIKFHGSQFRKAKELVGLDPEDCFALATYKIHAALRKQEAEHRPYIFVIVGVPGLTGSVVGDSIPEDLVQLTLLAHESPKVTGKRQIEDRIVARLTTDPATFGFDRPFEHYLRRIREAEWFALSARRADLLLRERLFERAYALRVRGFTRNYPGAELDMHFPLVQDLRPLQEFLQVLQREGMPGLVSRLERGTF